MYDYYLKMTKVHLMGQLANALLSGKDWSIVPSVSRNEFVKSISLMADQILLEAGVFPENQNTAKTP